MADSRSKGMVSMRKFLGALLVGGVVLSAGCSPAARWNDGQYEAEGSGYGGPIRVQVEIRRGRIHEVRVLQHSETPMVSDVAFERVPAQVVREQTWDVDTVTGATATSNGLRQAVKNALERAAK